MRVRLTESDFPYRTYEGTLDGPGQQPLELPAVFEGDFSVSVSDNFARGGRASGAVPPQGLPVEVTVQLTTTGRVAAASSGPTASRRCRSGPCASTPADA